MPQNYVIAEVPGPKGLKIATTDTTVTDSTGVKSPEWMVSLDALVTSQVAD
jgi:hypothetical protein